MATPAPGAPPPRPKTTTLMTLGGLAAAFGAASCCGLPLMLATAGIGSAWLTGVAVLAAPYRPILLIVGAVGLVGGAYLLFWRARRAACRPGSLSARSAFRGTIIASLLLGTAFLYLGYAYV